MSYERERDRDFYTVMLIGIIFACVVWLLFSVTDCGATEYWQGHGTVADPRQAGTPTIIGSLQVYELEDQEFAQASCVLLIDSYGPSIGAPLVEVPATKIAALFKFTVQNTSPIIACSFLVPGDCLSMSGHVLTSPDVAGQTWVADSVAWGKCP